MRRGHKLNKRDQRGWRIPREGTLSRKIYDLTLNGKMPAQIANTLRCDVGKVRVLLHRFRRPDEANERSYDYRADLREQQ